jgi:hypothetical protein
MISPGLKATIDCSVWDDDRPRPVLRERTDPPPEPEPEKIIQRGTLKSLILQHCREAWTTRVELEERIGSNRRGFQNAMDALIAEGRIERDHAASSKPMSLRLTPSELVRRMMSR